MSDIAINLQEQLRKSGVSDDDARRIAQSLDQSVEDALRKAIEHADRNRAETEEKMKAQVEVLKAREEQLRTEFVPAADYHARDKTLITREEFHAEIAELRKDIRTLYRLLVIAVIGGASAFVAIIGGQIALFVKLYFGA